MPVRLESLNLIGARQLTGMLIALLRLAVFVLLLLLFSFAAGFTFSRFPATERYTGTIIQFFLTPLVALQIEYSLLERTVEGELMPMARELGLGVTPWSPLKSGVLSGKYTRENAGKVKPDRGPWVEGSLDERAYRVYKELTAGQDAPEVRSAVDRYQSALLMPKWLIQEAAERYDLLNWPDLYRLGEEAQVNISNLTVRLQRLGLIYLREGDKTIYRSGLALEDEGDREDRVGQQDHVHDPGQADGHRRREVHDVAQRQADPSQDQGGVAEEQGDAEGERAGGKEIALEQAARRIAQRHDPPGDG